MEEADVLYGLFLGGMYATLAAIILVVGFSILLFTGNAFSELFSALSV